MMYRNWGKFFFLEKKYFRLVEFGPKFGILAFSAIFALFFRVPKNLIYINNAFNGYRYLKSTRKELSDGTLMLKKEYCLDRWNCDWNSYTFQKKYPPSRENDQSSPKCTKWLLKRIEIAAFCCIFQNLTKSVRPLAIRRASLWDEIWCIACCLEVIESRSTTAIKSLEI